MKKLQNNFTTPEQSERLLELGVPADSADCYHNDIAGKPFLIPYGTLFSDARHQFSKNTLPCWSVGRLMEIFDKCFTGKDGKWCSHREMQEGQTYMNYIMYVFRVNSYMFDFSKLED